MANTEDGQAQEVQQPVDNVQEAIGHLSSAAAHILVHAAERLSSDPDAIAQLLSIRKTAQALADQLTNARP